MEEIRTKVSNLEEGKIVRVTTLNGTIWVGKITSLVMDTQNIPIIFAIEYETDDRIKRIREFRYDNIESVDFTKEN